MNDEEIFHEALARSRPTERAAYLDRACAGDAALRASVEALLQANIGASGFLERLVSAPNATVDDPIAERAGTVIGPYKLLEQIGEGGMGLIFVAEQQQPVRRKVALKVIKPGMDTRQVVARFEAERQALALMDHPNIAKVHDGGTTDSGRPYFVMELVKGVPITDYCDQNQVSIRERLELFVQVCQAVQHAHQKGIIHRDIKPSNVLVMSHDGTPLVKVIDFGVAKAIGQQLTDKTIYTQFSQMIGTPLYMSPEQAGQSGLDVDTRSDIYSLGVLLYELLTGTTPFEKERLRALDYDEMCRIIREEEPARPSTRISTLGQAATTICTQRRSEPKRLSQLFRGELDWIVMKALEKDRNRRYETANGFALDVQRYLAGEPVLAAPASKWYRLRKVVRRHRGPVLAAGVVFVTLLIGIAGTTWGLVQAERHAKQARDERDAKDVALKAEQQARADETKARQQAFAALRSMTDEVVERKFAQGAELAEDDRAFLRGIIAQYDAFAAIKGDDPDGRMVRAAGRARVGTMRYRLGELREAEKDYGQALRIQQQLVADFPARLEFRQNLAVCHDNRGDLLSVTGRLAEAEKDYDQALRIQQQLVADFPAHREFRQNLARSHNNRAVVLRRAGRPQEAEKDYDQAVSIRKQLAADFPAHPEFRHELALSHGGRGVLLSEMGRPKEAEKDYEQALRIRKQLAADFPARPEFRQSLGSSYNSRGLLLSEMGRPQEAEKDYEEALRIRKQLAADFPAHREFRHDLARSYNNRGTLRSATGRRAEAAKDYEQALRILKQLAADSPNQPDLQSEVGGACVNLALLHYRQGNWAAAKRLLLEGRPYHLTALKASPRHPEYRRFYRTHVNLLTFIHAGLLEQVDAVCTSGIRRDLGWDAPADAYEAARLLSRCIPIVAKHDKLDDKQRKQAVQFYGDQAMKLLRDAVNKGYRDAAHLKKDADLAPLRPREDFRKLVAELEDKRK